MKKTATNYLKSIILSLLMAVALLGCDTQEIGVSEIEFFIAKEWKIQSVFRDGIKQTNEDLNSGDHLETFRLKLEDDFTFTRVSLIGGQVGGGSWQLTSGLTQLVLFVDEPHEERWLLLDLGIRHLEMRLLQDPSKPQLDIRYVLEPVKR